MTDSKKGGARRVAKDEGIVVRLREQKVAAVRAPARRIREGVLRERGEQTQALRHPPQLAVLQPLGVEQELLHDGGHGVPGGDRRVVNADLRGELGLTGRRTEQEQSERGA